MELVYYRNGNVKGVGHANDTTAHALKSDVRMTAILLYRLHVHAAAADISADAYRNHLLKVASN